MSWPLRIWGLLTAPGAVYLLVAHFWSSFPFTRSTPFVGFGSFEGDGLKVLLLLPFLALFVLWLLTVVVKTGVALRRHSAIPRGRWAVILGSLLFLALCSTGDGTWNRIFAARLAKAGNGAGPFIGAVVEGDQATARAFLAHGVALNGCHGGATALHFAVEEGRLPMVRYLLDQGADVNAVSGSASTPVDLAEGKSHADVVALLRARGGKEYNELAPDARRAPCP